MVAGASAPVGRRSKSYVNPASGPSRTLSLRQPFARDPRPPVRTRPPCLLAAAACLGRRRAGARQPSGRGRSRPVAGRARARRPAR
ncbi:MAG: hypothetical protein ACK56F_24345, partial [bacterium]